MPGSIFSFVAAHDGSKAGTVSRQLSRTLCDVLDSEGVGNTVLRARDIHPRQLAQVLNYAREKYPVVCADLSGAKEAHALPALRVSEGIFLVATSDKASLAAVREKAAWLRSIDLGERCGVLLERVPGGAKASDVEDLTGLPVSALIENQQQIGQLASWLAASQNVEAAAKYACA